jgi:biopolymer transport protein TolR
MAVSLVPDDELKADINVTPLVDVMLVLLVIFMVVTPLLRQQVPIELPIAEQSRDSPDADQVTLTAAAGGELLLNHEAIVESALTERLHDVYAARADKTIFLEADGALPYRRVVALMDLCRQAGVERIGVVTQKPHVGS